MSAEGYKSAPLSDELERRIRERLESYRRELARVLDERLKVFAPIYEHQIAALEWVLNEAEALKFEPSPAVKSSRFSEICHACGHLHADESECGMPMGGGKCLCDRRVTA